MSTPCGSTSFFMCANKGMGASARFLATSLVFLLAYGEALQLNQIQFLATHNSYHVAPAPDLYNLMARDSVQTLLGGQNSSTFIPQAWQVTELPISQQLDAGVRSLEIDIYPDHRGGLFNQAALRKLAGEDGLLGNPKLAAPGFKVLHVADFDFNTTCLTLADCLAEVAAWSDAHPAHLPITIFVEVKQGEEVQELLGSQGGLVISSVVQTGPPPNSLVTPEPVDGDTLLELEAAILDVFNESRLIMPDDLRGDADSLAQAVLSPRGQWPQVESLRGRMMFALTPGKISDMYAAEVRPDLEDALLFATGSPEKAQKDGAYVIVELGTDALGTGRAPQDLKQFVPQIDMLSVQMRELAAKGYLLRVRADVQTVEARENFTYRRDAAATAGAHFLLTDFIVPPSLFTSPYQVNLGGKAGRCNPVTAPPSDSPAVRSIEMSTTCSNLDRAFFI